MKSLFFIALLLVIISCSDRTEPLPILNFAAALKHPQRLDVSRIAEKIDYVGLETREDCLLNGGNLYKIKENLYFRTGSYYNRHIYKFSVSGKFLGSIGTLGLGPEEYNELHYANISPDGRYIYLMTRHELLKYTSSGDFVERIPIKKLSALMPMPFVIDCQGRWFFRCPEVAFKNKALLICDSSFNLLCDFDRQVIRSNKGIVPMEQMIAYDGNYVYYHEPLQDTLYGINADLKRKPVAIMEFGSEQPQTDSFDSFNKLKGKRLNVVFHFLKNLWFFQNGNEFPKLNKDLFVYLKPSSELIYLKNSFIQWEGVNWLPVGYTPDEWIWRADMVSLLDNRDKITNPELKALAMQMDENSNPILAIVKIKKDL